MFNVECPSSRNSHVAPMGCALHLVATLSVGTMSTSKWSKFHGPTGIALKSTFRCFLTTPRTWPSAVVNRTERSRELCRTTSNTRKQPRRSSSRQPERSGGRRRPRSRGSLSRQSLRRSSRQSLKNRFHSANDESLVLEPLEFSPKP